MEIRFERAVLYDEVWSTPMTRLAARYGLSDNGLRKVCKALAIPLPSAGHWARIAAGHSVPRIPLPADAARTVFFSSVPDAKPVEDSDDARADAKWLSERLAFEAEPAHRVEVPIPVPSGQWHPMLRGSRDALRAAVRGVEQSRRDYAAWIERRRRPASDREPAQVDGEAFRWSRIDSTAWLIPAPAGVAAVRCTPESLERALALLNAFAKAAQRRGFSLEADEHTGSPCVLDGHGERLSLRIVERTTTSMRDERERSVWLAPKERRSATGDLRLLVGRPLGELRFGDDDPSGPLEHRLNDVFIRVWRLVVRMRAETRQRVQDALREARIAEERRVLAQERADATRQLEQEQARRDALLNEAHDWGRAARLRQYIAHIEAQADGPVPQSLAGWIAWATMVADALDPTARRLRGDVRPDGAGQSAPTAAPQPLRLPE